MSGLKRLIDKFLTQPDRIRVGDVVRLLEMLGYTEKKNPGSHRVFHKKGSPVFTVPTKHGRYLRKRTIKQVVNLLELEGYGEK